jgi:aa3 type cytochrome c oxidase subunit IV
MGVDFSKSHRAMDARQHEQSYSAFLKLLIATCVLVIVILGGMAAFLT